MIESILCYFAGIGIGWFGYLILTGYFNEGNGDDKN